MPIVSSSYFPNKLFANGHLQTIYGALWRKGDECNYERRRIHTYDQDFIDLDWLRSGSKQLAIISHGLEGSSNSSYVKNMAQSLNQSGWDVVAWNMRGCGGEPNRHLRSYHDGMTEDLHRVFSHCLFKKKYQRIVLIGFSIGGNLVLKFLGEQGARVQNLISAAAVYSVPCDLSGVANKLANPKNWIYMNFFRKKLYSKLLLKNQLHPGKLDLKKVKTFKNFYDYDNHFTVPWFGFKSVEHYWNSCSANNFLDLIKVPTLIVNPKNDPFLTPDCYPIKTAEQNSMLYLEMPDSGGHNGFLWDKKHQDSWLAQRSMNFFSEVLAHPNNLENSGNNGPGSEKHDQNLRDHQNKDRGHSILAHSDQSHAFSQ